MSDASNCQLEVEKDYTIKHFFESKQLDDSAQGIQKPRMPFLGRMNFSKVFKPMSGFDKVMNGMKKVPLMFLPLFALPNAAFAYSAPPGFDDFDPIH